MNYLAEHKYPNILGPRGPAVVGGLATHIRKVDTFPEHVAGDRGFGRRNPQASAQNARPVGDSGSMEQQHPVAFVLERKKKKAISAGRETGRLRQESKLIRCKLIPPED